MSISSYNVLLFDIFAYSLLQNDKQFEAMELLTETARGRLHTKPLKDARFYPTGDGFSVVEIADRPPRELIDFAAYVVQNVHASHHNIRLRASVSSGIGRRYTDITAQENIAGSPLNSAARINAACPLGMIVLSDGVHNVLANEQLDGTLSGVCRVIDKHGVSHRYVVYDPRHPERWNPTLVDRVLPVPYVFSEFKKRYELDVTGSYLNVFDVTVENRTNQQLDTINLPVFRSDIYDEPEPENKAGLAHYATHRAAAVETITEVLLNGRPMRNDQVHYVRQEVVPESVASIVSSNDKKRPALGLIEIAYRVVLRPQSIQPDGQARIRLTTRMRAGFGRLFEGEFAGLSVFDPRPSVALEIQAPAGHSIELCRDSDTHLSMGTKVLNLGTMETEDVNDLPIPEQRDGLLQWTIPWPRIGRAYLLKFKVVKKPGPQPY